MCEKLYIKNERGSLNLRKEGQDDKVQMYVLEESYM